MAEVRAHEPRTVYEAYRLADRRSFIHFMAFEDDAAEEAHRRAAYTEAFVAALYPSCIEPPEFTELRPIG